MSNRHHQNGIWEGGDKPGSLTEWIAGRNLQGRPKSTPRNEPGESFAADFTAAVLAEMAKSKPPTPAVTVKPFVVAPPASADGKGAINHSTSGHVKPSQPAPNARPVICTAKAGANSLSLGNCACDDCQADRSAVEKALRKSRIERELKNLEAENQPIAQPTEVPATPTTPASPTPRWPRRRSSFSTFSAKYDDSLDSDGESYTEETITIVDYETHNSKTQKKKAGCCANCGRTNCSEWRHERTTIVEQEAGTSAPKPTDASHPEQRNDVFTAAQAWPHPLPTFAPQQFPAHGGLQHEFPAPYAYYGVSQPDPNNTAPGFYNANSHGQCQTPMDRSGPYPYQTSQTAPAPGGFLQGGPRTPARHRGRIPPSPQRMPRSAMRGSRERERSRSVPSRSPAPPNMSRATTPPASRWNQSPQSFNPPTMSGSGAATPPGNFGNQGRPNGGPQNAPIHMSGPSQRQQGQMNGRRTSGRQGSAGNNKLNVGSHRDAHYPPGYSAPPNNWKDPETDLNGLQRNDEQHFDGQRFGNQREQHFDNNSAATESNNFHVPGAWYSSSDTDSSISWEQTGFDMEYRKWLGRWDVPSQRPGPDTPDIDQQVNNLMISLPRWADVEADHQKREEGWIDHQSGRRAPPNVQW